MALFLFALKFKYLLFELDFSMFLKFVPIPGEAFLTQLLLNLSHANTLLLEFTVELCLKGGQPAQHLSVFEPCVK